jgi:CspA family cold shock protein
VYYGGYFRGCDENIFRERIAGVFDRPRRRLTGAACVNTEQENEAVREKGVVKWFNAAKGYGFIQRSSGEDVFVHFSAIEMSGYRTLEEGSEVEFEVKRGPKGLQAESVNRP